MPTKKILELELPKEERCSVAADFVASVVPNNSKLATATTQHTTICWRPRHDTTTTTPRPRQTTTTTTRPKSTIPVACMIDCHDRSWLVGLPSPCQVHVKHVTTLFHSYSLLPQWHAAITLCLDFKGKQYFFSSSLNAIAAM